MKKFIKIFIVLILILFVLFVNSVKATATVNITATPNKTTLSPGDELKINILASNVAIEGGITSYAMRFVYDTNIFDIEVEDRTENEADLQNMATQLDVDTVDLVSMDTTETADWSLLIGKTGTEKLLMGSNEEAQTSNQQIGQIKLVVKDNATTGITNISLNTITAGNDTVTSDDNSINDISIALTISSQPVAPTPKTSTNTNTTSNKVSQNTMPQTGIKETMPIIFIALIIVGISYFKYKKYKNI